MTLELEEAIKCCEEEAEINEFDVEIFSNRRGSKISEECRERASQCRQLAEWLKELKAYRKAYEEIKRLPIAWEFGEGVIRCLTIIEDCLEEVKDDVS